MDRLAIVAGKRTPFGKGGGALKGMQADDLGAWIARELLSMLSLPSSEIDEVICGNVGQPAHSANIARVVALKSGVPISTPAVTVHRNCASGMESITTAAERIFSGRSRLVLAGGCESMSNIPLLYGPQMTELFAKLMKAKTFSDKLSVVSKFRLSFLKPIIGIQLGLTDPTCGLNMGQTAEVLAREFSISRDEQDRYALTSHQRALAAQSSGFFDEEIHPTLAPDSDAALMSDEGPNAKQSLDRLRKLKPYFDRQAGTVTVGNACPVSDGAAMVLLCKESFAKERGWSPLGYLRHWDYAGLEPKRMGLGPVYATAKLLKQGAYNISDFESIELNEAFAAQVIANQRAFASKQFGQDALGLGDALGALDPDKMNPNGGAIALGHPVGTTGTRLVITLLRQMRRQNQNLGLATLCVGGGQGAAMVLEVA